MSYALPIVIALIWIGSLAWAFYDGRRRGDDAPWVLPVVVFFTWPVGLFVWYLLRPPLPAE